MSEKRKKINPGELKKGNHQAFEDIFIVYFKKVKYFIFSFIKSEKDAEELAQDVFIKIWENHANLNIDKSFDSFLYTITRNMVFNYLKHKLVERTYNEYIYFNKSGYADDPEMIIYAKEIGLLIEMAVEKMPERRRKIYKLSRHNGFTNDEIAETLGISKKTVENQLSLALNELKKIITIFSVFFILN